MNWNWKKKRNNALDVSRNIKEKKNFCPRCGAPLDQESAKTSQEARELTGMLAEAIVEDETSINEIVERTRQTKELSN